MSIVITVYTTEPTVAGPFDLWQIETELSGEESFAAADDTAVWSVSLPVSTAAAQQTLVRSLAETAHRQQTISQAGHYLQMLNPAAVEAVSFSLENSPITAAANLLAVLNYHRQPNQAESFAPAWLNQLAGLPASWNDTLRECRDFVTQAVELLQPSLRIQTDLAGVRLAQTLVRASGDLETVYLRRSSPPQRELHRHTVQLTLETRQSLAFFLAQVSAGAASLAAKFYVAQWVALPAAYRFVQDVVRRAEADNLPARLKAWPAVSTRPGKELPDYRKLPEI